MNSVFQAKRACYHHYLMVKSESDWPIHETRCHYHTYANNEKQCAQNFYCSFEFFQEAMLLQEFPFVGLVPE